MMKIEETYFFWSRDRRDLLICMLVFFFVNLYALVFTCHINHTYLLICFITNGIYYKWEGIDFQLKKFLFCWLLIKSIFYTEKQCTRVPFFYSTMILKIHINIDNLLSINVLDYLNCNTCTNQNNYDLRIYVLLVKKESMYC